MHLRFFTEPVITMMARHDYFYVDKDFSKYSLKRLDGFLTYTESI